MKLINATEDCLHSLLYARDSDDYVSIDDCTLVLTLGYERMQSFDMLVFVLASTFFMCTYQLFLKWKSHRSAEFFYDRATIAWFVTGWACAITLVLLHLPSHFKANLKAAVAIISLAIMVLLILEIDNCLSDDEEEDSDEEDSDSEAETDGEDCYLDITGYQPIPDSAIMYDSNGKPAVDLSAPLVQTFSGTKPQTSVLVV